MLEREAAFRNVFNHTCTCNDCIKNNALRNVVIVLLCEDCTLQWKYKVVLGAGGDEMNQMLDF